jgi:hypothetical protein
MLNAPIRDSGLTEEGDEMKHESTTFFRHVFAATTFEFF